MLVPVIVKLRTAVAMMSFLLFPVCRRLLLWRASATARHLQNGNPRIALSPSFAVKCPAPRVGTRQGVRSLHESNESNWHLVTSRPRPYNPFQYSERVHGTTARACVIRDDIGDARHVREYWLRS